MTIKIHIKVGGVEVDYEGTETFLDEKLHKLISDVSALAKQAPAERDVSDSSGNTENKTSSTLASFLKEKNATDNQNRRFLATAQWLHLKDLEQIKTGDVTKALRENRQTRLGNASECLNQNISKGYCEKDGKEFYVTNEGRDSLG